MRVRRAEPVRCWISHNYPGSGDVSATGRLVVRCERPKNGVACDEHWRAIGGGEVDLPVTPGERDYHIRALTYDVGTDDVLQPKLLRAYNELLHRVTASLRDHIRGENGMSINNVVEMLHDFGAQHNCIEETNWVFRRSLDRTHDS